MGYRSLQACVADLESAGHLVRIADEIDPNLEMAEIQRRVFAADGPALLFTRVKGCRFPMLGNLFGNLDRVRYVFRDTLERVARLIDLKLDPMLALAHPLRSARLLPVAWAMRPKRVSSGEILKHEISIGELPQLKSWPRDGGAFITLPQVYTEDPDRPGVTKSNLGMYRVQLSGGSYQADKEIGLHYQIHRGIGVHHTAAVRRGEPLRVNIFVGGPPAMTLAAVMPLPEGLSELTFAGALSGRRIRMVHRGGQLPVHADADFCICGEIDPGRMLPEGPFGDHLGYYSLAHDFPVLKVHKVYHRPGAIWPFTVVGRPPQEDTAFGQVIHELTGNAIASVLPGVKAIHAVDAAGVHPLLLAIGSERYTPYSDESRPQELLTQANAILGQGQLSLAKYLWIADQRDDPRLDLHDVSAFLGHMLSRLDFTRDLHFQTRTTIDTLDYSGGRINEGSKLVLAARGNPRRDLAHEMPASMPLPEGFSNPQVCLPGVLAIQVGGSRIDIQSEVRSEHQSDARSENASDARPMGPESASPAVRICDALRRDHPVNRFPLIVLVDDSRFTAASLNNLLWVTFTRSNPAADVHGIESFTAEKHWGCHGSLVIDARAKPHHAPPLEEDPAVSRRVDALASRGGPLHGLF
jgi:4-hydroxy-3-polyprenylbenzoate decarboxylase